MGAHVTRSKRGTAATIYVSRPGDKNRPSKSRPGKGGGSDSKGAVKTGGSAGTMGDFGEDVE